ncbi:MAG: hypothetical protein V1790_17515 [Planctomycetota bacterium]
MSKVNSIADLALFKTYAMPADYETAIGLKPPPFDPKRRPKYWSDPDAWKSRSAKVSYPRVIARTELGLPVVGDDGKPMLELLQIDKAEAISVNIPPDATNVEGAGVPPCPMPLAEIPEGYELYFKYGNLPDIRNLAAVARETEGFTPADRALIQGIAKKLGV